MYKDINVKGTIMDVPSVSQITGLIDKSDALLPWSARMAVEYIQSHKAEFNDSAHSFDNICQSAVYAYKDVNKTACTTGTDIHKLVEYYAKGDEVKSDETAFQSFLEFVEDNDVEFIESEIFLLSERYLYAGTCDLICNVNGKKIIVDIKTGKALYDEYKYQLAGYRIAYNEKTGEELPIAVLRLGKEKVDYDYKIYKNEHNLENAFLSLLGFYYNAKKRRLKNNTRIKEIWG